MAMEPNLVAGTLDSEPINDPIGVRRAETITTVLLISEGILIAKIVLAIQLVLAFIGSLPPPLFAFWHGACDPHGQLKAVKYGSMCRLAARTYLVKVEAPRNVGVLLILQPSKIPWACGS